MTFPSWTNISFLPFSRLWLHMPSNVCPGCVQCPWIHCLCQLHSRSPSTWVELRLPRPRGSGDSPPECACTRTVQPFPHHLPNSTKRWSLPAYICKGACVQIHALLRCSANSQASPCHLIGLMIAASTCCMGLPFHWVGCTNSLDPSRSSMERYVSKLLASGLILSSSSHEGTIFFFVQNDR